MIKRRLLVLTLLGALGFQFLSPAPVMAIGDREARALPWIFGFGLNWYFSSKNSKNSKRSSNAVVEAQGSVKKTQDAQAKTEEAKQENLAETREVLRSVRKRVDAGATVTIDPTTGAITIGGGPEVSTARTQKVADQRTLADQVMIVLTGSPGNPEPYKFVAQEVALQSNYLLPVIEPKEIVPANVSIFRNDKEIKSWQGVGTTADQASYPQKLYLEKKDFAAGDRLTVKAAFADGSEKTRGFVLGPLQQATEAENGFENAVEIGPPAANKVSEEVVENPEPKESKKEPASQRVRSTSDAPRAYDRFWVYAWKQPYETNPYVPDPGNVFDYEQFIAVCDFRLTPVLVNVFVNGVEKKSWEMPSQEPGQPLEQHREASRDNYYDSCALWLEKDRIQPGDKVTYKVAYVDGETGEWSATL